MKKVTTLLSLVLLFLVFSLFIPYNLAGQEQSKVPVPLPDNINKIVTASCMPCHTSNGRLLSRTKLNFTEWSQYSTEKQEAKAEKIYSVLKKGEMPPKSARETNPGIIPNKDQVEAIGKWAESLKIGNEQ